MRKQNAQQQERIQASLSRIVLPAEREAALLARVFAEADREEQRETRKGERRMQHTTNTGKRVRAGWAAAAALLLALTLVACIPEARAEVLGWFGIDVTTPGDYLSGNPEGRRPNEALDEIITSAAPEDNDSAITDGGEYGELSALMREAFDREEPAAVLGKTLYDGKAITQTVTFCNGSGIWLLEKCCGGSLTHAIIPVEKLDGYFGGAPVPEAYLNGTYQLKWEVDSWCFLELPDGTRIAGGGWNVAESARNEEPLASHLDEMATMNGNTFALDKFNKAYLEENDITGYAAMVVRDPAALEAMADEKGLVTAELGMRMEFMLDGDGGENTTVFAAKLGQVTIDVEGYKHLTARTGSTAGRPVTWTGETTLTQDEAFLENDVRIWRLMNRHVSLDGLTMRALPGITVNALGVRQMQTEIQFPETWTKEDRDALLNSMEFQVLINGEAGSWVPGAVHINADGTDENGRLLYDFNGLREVPLELLPEIREITLVPRIVHLTAAYSVKFDADGELQPVKTVELAVGEAAELDDVGADTFWSDHVYTDYPQYALTFTIDP